MSANKKQQLVSVIVPVFNVEKYIGRCLDSILAQTYDNFEVIVVDDGSTDSSGDICDKYKGIDSRMRVFHKTNSGLSGARNYGIDRARGRYITFIDSDDYVEKDYIDVLVSDLELNNCDISMVKHFVRYPKKVLNESTGNKELLTSRRCLEKMLYDDDVDVSAWGKLYKRKLFEKVRYPEGLLFEDSAVTFKLFDDAKYCYLNSIPLYNYVIRKESITGIEFGKKNLDLIYATKDMVEFIMSKYPELKMGCDRRLMYAYLSVFRKFALSKNKRVNSEYGKEIFGYISKHRISVLRDSRIPRRDRVALKLAFNYRFFILINMLYERFRGV